MKSLQLALCLVALVLISTLGPAHASADIVAHTSQGTYATDGRHADTNSCRGNRADRYSFDQRSGCPDCALANASLEPQATNAIQRRVNADKPPITQCETVDNPVRPHYPGRYLPSDQDALIAGLQPLDHDYYVHFPLVARRFPTVEAGGHVYDGELPYADRMRYAGMNWTKLRFHYPQGASGIIAGSQDRAFKIRLTALGSGHMVTEPDFEHDFAAWVGELAADGADAIEVWNEPNLEREWKPGHISPTLYGDLPCAAYASIKGVDSEVLVIGAAPAPTGVFAGCGPNGCDDLPWLEGLYAAGAGDCRDHIGAHHLPGATSPSARSGHPADPGGSHHSWYFLWQTEEHYEAFKGTRSLFYTELGYASQEGVLPFPSWFEWATGTTNAEQAAWLTEAVQLSINTGMADYIIVWNIDFPRYGSGPQDGYAIIRPDGSCPACESLHGLLGSR